MLFRSFALSGAVTILLAAAPAVLAQPAATWGIVFQTSQTGEAQQRFLEGVASMHMHMFEDAEEHFKAAQKLAPDFAMAYWGEALNQHRTIWSYHNRDKALAALARLGGNPVARAAKAKTEREKSYLAAIEVLFGEGTQRQREAAYSAAMKKLSTAHPDDAEALAWYCLSLMRVTPPGMTRDQTDMEMASAALRVLARNPRHPGANRYLIQSTDDPVHTALGWPAVENLSKVTANAAEVIHIPSHVYVQHGLWAEAAEANDRAFEASMAWTKAHNWGLADLNPHNYGHLLIFSHYAHLQSGQLSKAEAIRDRIRQDYAASGKADWIRRFVADVHARCIVDLAEWDEVKELAAFVRDEKLVDPAIWLAIGIGAARSQQLELARQALAMLPTAKPDDRSIESLPAREVRGLIALAEGQRDLALRELSEAAAIDQRNLSRIGTPPTPIKPANELYGEVLLEIGRDKEALEQFEIGLTIFRRRPLLLLGAARASHRLGLTAKATGYYQELRDVWRSADADHPFAGEAKRQTNQ